MSPAPQVPTLNHVRAALLMSIFATESNLKNEGATWLATAVRLAQVLGLHIDNNTETDYEVEMRRRLWWAIYVIDRYGTNNMCATPADVYLDYRLLGHSSP